METFGIQGSGILPGDFPLLAQVNKLYSDALGAIDLGNFRVIFTQTEDGRPDTLYPESSNVQITTVRLTSAVGNLGWNHFPLQTAKYYGHELFHVYQRLKWHGEDFGNNWNDWEPLHPFAHAASLAVLFRIDPPAGISCKEQVEYLQGEISPKYPEYSGGGEIASQNDWDLAKIQSAYEAEYRTLISAQNSLPNNNQVVDTSNN